MVNAGAAAVNFKFSGIFDVSCMAVLNSGQQGLLALTTTGIFYLITVTMEPFVAAVHVANLVGPDIVHTMVGNIDDIWVNFGFFQFCY